MRAMAALSKPQAFRFDAVLQQARAAARERLADRAPRRRWTVAEETPAAAGAAHLRRRGARCRRPFDQVVDGRGRDAGRQPLSVLPLLRDLIADFVPVAFRQRL